MGRKEITTKEDLMKVIELFENTGITYWLDGGWGVDILAGKQIRILKRSVMTMIFDFEPWQLDIDIDLTKQLYRSCKGDFVWVEKK